MKFKTKIKQADGQIIEELREAGDKFALARELRGSGQILLSATAVEATAVRGHGKIFTNLFRGKVKLKEKIMFASNLASMITAGLALSRALDILARQTTNQYFKNVINKLLEAVNTGQNLSTAMASFDNIFPPVFIAMVGAGEESGKLPEALSIVSEQLNKSYEIRRKIKGALMYPAIIVALISVLGVLMMIFLMPVLTKTFKSMGVALPLSTRILIGISNFLGQHFLLFIFSVLFALAALYLGFRSKPGQKLADYIFLRLPIAGNLTRQTNSAVMMRTISSLIKAGVSMVESLRITERVLQNIYYKEVMTLSIDRVQRGLPLSELLRERTELFPILAGELVLVGEETGNLAEMLERGAVFYEGEVDQVTKNFSSVIEPVIMVAIGIAVAFFAVSMMGPMYSLSGAIKT